MKITSTWTNGKFDYPRSICDTSRVMRSQKKELHERIRTKIDKRTESAGNKDCEAKHR